MTVREAKSKFIESWGAIGTKWGINRTMAAIHALLLVSNEPISTEDVMDSLNISRGNSNMNLRALVSWGLIYKVMIPGERMEYFEAEKDVHKIVVHIIKERKRQELEPIRSVLSELKQVKTNSAEGKQFSKLINEIDNYADIAEILTDKITKSEESWLLKTLKKALKLN